MFKFKARTISIYLSAALLSLLPAAGALGQSGDRFANFRIAQPSGHGEQFLAGFYLYPYGIQRTAAHLNRDYATYRDAWVKGLTSKGFNLFYVVAESPFETWLQLSEKYRFKMIVQLDFAYLTEPTSSEVKKKSGAAIQFIKKYKNHSNVLAFSIKEEPTITDMAPLEEYFSAITAAVPGAPLHLLHNQRRPLGYTLKNSPLIAATDRYAFWGWDASAGGYLATPASALKWFRHDMEPYSNYARENGAHFQAVFTTAVNVKLTNESKVRSGSFGHAERILQLAASGLQGWSRLDGGKIKYTKYYRPPPNCTRAMVWLSVLNGARSILHWSGNPTDPIQERILSDELYRKSQGDIEVQSSDVSKALERGDFMMQVAGPDNTGSYMLDEYAEAVRKLHGYGWALNRMSPSTDQSEARVESQHVASRLFDLPNFNGKLLLLVNTDVGTWGANSVASLIGLNEPLAVDSVGNLVGFSPRLVARKIKLGSPQSTKFINLLDETRPEEDGQITIRPGDAVLLFNGDETEFADLRRLTGLDANNGPRPPTDLTVSDPNP